MDSNVDPINKIDPSETVLQLHECKLNDIKAFLLRFQLDLILLDDHQEITGSFWGGSEAGLMDNKLYARNDTPIHSILHETCHYICMDDKRRKQLNTNANGTSEEENAVCYLQILLADHFPTINRQRIMQDMDNWGYSFRLGSTKAWFENDAEDASSWLKNKDLINKESQPNFTLRY